MKCSLALAVSSLALLASAQLELEPVQAAPVAQRVVRFKGKLGLKPKSRRTAQLDLAAFEMPSVTRYVAGVIFQLPALDYETSRRRPKRGPHIDMEGLVVGDMHIRLNLILSTDTRYDNSSTREHAQRDELDFLAARQHGEARGPDPLSVLLRKRELITPGSPGSNDPGYDVAVAISEQLLTQATQATATSAPTSLPTCPATPLPSAPPLTIELLSPSSRASSGSCLLPLSRAAGPDAACLTMFGSPALPFFALTAATGLTGMAISEFLKDREKQGHKPNVTCRCYQLAAICAYQRQGMEMGTKR